MLYSIAIECGNDEKSCEYVDDIITTTNNNVTALQTKTQNITATSTSNNILHSVLNTLSFGESFKIQDSAITPIIDIDNTNIDIE
jgi:hypothetical protein